MSLHLASNMVGYSWEAISGGGPFEEKNMFVLWAPRGLGDLRMLIDGVARRVRDSRQLGPAERVHQLRGKKTVLILCAGLTRCPAPSRLQAAHCACVGGACQDEWTFPRQGLGAVI